MLRLRLTNAVEVLFIS